MNRFQSSSRRLICLVPFVTAALLAGCGGGGSQDPILGAGNGNAIVPPVVVPPVVNPPIVIPPVVVPPAAAPPTVSAVAPVNGATGVAVNSAIISATFSETMSPLTGSASFTLTCAAPCTNPTGAVALDASNKIASYTLTSGTSLAPSTVYTGTIIGARSLVSGLALANTYAWQFTTGVAPDTTRPTVSITVPVTTAGGATPGVPTNTAITAIFSENMAPASITGTSFTVGCAAPCVAPAGTVSYSVGTRTAVFTPAAVLAAGTTYQVTITSAATDLAGNALAGNQGAATAASNYLWSFLTAAAPAAAGNVSIASTNPGAGATGVCTTASVNATFTVPSSLMMNPATVTASTFTVKSAALVPVTAASVVLDATGRLATFTPQTPLVAGTTYTATVSGGATGVKDLAIVANTMLGDASWNFSVVDCSIVVIPPVVIPPVVIPPIVISAIPLGSASTFGIFGGSAGMTNQGVNTVINGDIGTTAVSTAVTGYHDTGVQCIYTETGSNVGSVNGKIYTAPPAPTVGCPTEGTAVTFQVASVARGDALSAYNALVAKAGGPDPGAGNLANLTLVAGVYTAASGSFKIEGGNLTLDAKGDANAVWVFQMATSLTVGGPGAAFPSSIIMANGAQAKNVFWQVGSAATINAGGGGTMVGTIISQAGVAISTAGNVALVTLNGRALSLGASVTLVNTVINVPAP